MEKKLLESLGLSDSEIKLYKTILKAKKVNPTELAKLTGIKRTTAYSMVHGLIEKGLVVEDATKRPKVFSPAGSDEINLEIDLEKKRSEERQKLLAQVGATVDQQEAAEHYPVPQIRFIEEDKIEEFMRKRTPIWNQSMLDTNERTWWGFQDHTFVEYYGDWIKWYWKQTPEELNLKLISNRATSEVNFSKSKKLERRLIKFWGEAASFHSTTWVIGDYLVMINTRTEPFYLVEIQNHVMAHDQRAIFKNLWDMI